MPHFRRPRSNRSRSRREILIGRLHARRAWRMSVIIGVAVLGGMAAALFAKLCDEAMVAHERLYHLAR